MQFWLISVWFGCFVGGLAGSWLVLHFTANGPAD